MIFAFLSKVDESTWKYSCSGDGDGQQRQELSDRSELSGTAKIFSVISIMFSFWQKFLMYKRHIKQHQSWVFSLSGWEKLSQFSFVASG